MHGSVTSFHLSFSLLGSLHKAFSHRGSRCELTFSRYKRGRGPCSPTVRASHTCLHTRPPLPSPHHTSCRAATSHDPDSAKRRELLPRAGLSGVPRGGRGPSDCPSDSWLWGFAYVIGDDRHLGQRPARAHAFPVPRKRLLQHSERKRKIRTPANKCET